MAAKHIQVAELLAESSDKPNTSKLSQSKQLSKLFGDAELLTNHEAAVYIGVTPGTLGVWRSTKRYEISYIKVGHLVKYRKEALDAFLATQTVLFAAPPAKQAYAKTAKLAPRSAAWRADGIHGMLAEMGDCK